jgi:hypothetical protein
VPAGADRKKALDLSADTRKFEISLFWQRSLFFWGFIAAAFVAYVAATKEPRDPDLLLAVAAFGLVCSVAWTLANRGSKYWQENWEWKLEHFEQDLGMPLFTDWKPRGDVQWWGSWRYSVSRLTIALSDFTVGVWLVLMLKALPHFQLPPWLSGTWVIPVATAIYIASMLRWGRSRGYTVRTRMWTSMSISVISIYMLALRSLRTLGSHLGHCSDLGHWKAREGLT